jgi:hypothetical protein
MRWKAHGDPLIVLNNRAKSLIERFEEKVELIPFSECHYWTGSIAPNGYGQFDVGGKTKLAHRVAYEIYIGPIPDGLNVCHTCDIRDCVNPRHFFAGSQQDNIDDMVNKGRACNGSKQGGAILTEADVVQIRNLNLTQKVMAKVYGVAQSSISNVIIRKTWKHI